MKIATLACATGLILLIIIIPVCALNEIRSNIYNLSQKEVTLDGINFPGFYCDFDDNTVTEKLTLRLSNIDPDGASATLSDQPDANGYRGAVYTTYAELTDFDFKPWGQYEKINFLGEGYFAAYDKKATYIMNETGQMVPCLYDKSEDCNLMADDQVSEILTDTDNEQTVNPSHPLELEDDYKLAIKTIDADGEKVHAELIKKDQVVDSKVIQLSTEDANMRDGTYYYKKALGGTKDIVIIAVHFQSIFVGSDGNSARVDGIFQISDKPISLKRNQHYGKMSIREVDPAALTIKMDNKDNKIIISKDKDILLMNDIYIHTADPDDISASNSLRYFIHKHP